MELTNKRLVRLKLPYKEKEEARQKLFLFEAKEVFENFKKFLVSLRILICATQKFDYKTTFFSYQKSFVKAITDNKTEKTLADLSLRGERAKQCCEFLNKVEEVVPFRGGTDETEWFPKYRSGNTFRSSAEEDEFLMKHINKNWIDPDEFEKKALELTMKAKDLQIKARMNTLKLSQLCL